MLYVVLLSAFMLLFLLIIILLRPIFKRQMVIDKRVAYIEKMEDVLSREEELSFNDRVILPIFTSIGKRILKLTPENSMKRRKETYEQAGFLRHISYERLVARRIITTILTTVLLGLTLWVLNVMPVIILFSMCWSFTFVLVVFRFKTKVSITTRGNSMTRDLPYVLDLITVSVEAGLSLDGAIGRIITNVPGALSDEFSKTLKEMRMGIDKKIALRNLSYRCGVRDVSILVNALIQADELGVSLGKVLRIEGAQLREKRKQLAKEKAMKAPVKMLFPTMIFIFPSVFIIILGPAVIKIFETFR